MNLARQALMSAPSMHSTCCVVCGAPYPTQHHVVPRSAGGHDGPTLSLCGHGTAGCHGKAESRLLFFTFDGGWTWHETDTRGNTVAFGRCRVTDE